MSLAILAAMASHFSMVGFELDLTNEAAAGAAAAAYVQQCELSRLRDQDHVCVVRDATGAELWIGLRKTGQEEMELVTLNPAFAGEGKAAVTVDGDVSPAAWKAFEVRVQGRISADEIPLILDLADPREAPRFTRGAVLNLDITAFADKISVHDSEAAYYASQTGDGMKFASTHFIPSGMFADEGAAAEPAAHALFAGKILKTELRRNEKGAGEYRWFLVQTIGDALVNVVADPETLKATPKVGGYLAGSFWLSARLSKH